MKVDDYFSTGPSFERPIFEVVVAHLRSLDPDVWFEPVSVGVFFKRRTTFVQLRTMTKWVAVGFNLDRKLQSPRLSRKVVEHGNRFYHVVNISSPQEIDEQIIEWLTEAWDDDAPES